jgi:retron-type reverse transcriptase
MGARKERSTMSAIGLLTSCVQTAWRAKPGSVVSMLSLDLAGAFDNVPHNKLLEILHRKRLPEWIIRAIAYFIQDRRTRITYTGFESDWIRTETGIPQGSPLSPILFLFFISELLEKFQDPKSDILGFGFVDDINLITWDKSAEENCRRLTAAHS